MNLLDIKLGPLMLVAGYLLVENPKNFANFSALCKKTNKAAKRITESLHFTPLEPLYQQRNEKQKELLALRGPSGFDGIINDAWNKKEAKEKNHSKSQQHFIEVARNRYDNLMEEYFALIGTDSNPGKISTLSQQIEEEVKQGAATFLKKIG